MDKPVIQLIMDSGAYSAHRLGIDINLDKYGKFVIDNTPHLAASANLDYIYPQDTNISAQKSLDNFKYLWDMGAKTMPIFHWGESISYLDKMLELGADYIGLSASVKSMAASWPWYNDCWRHVTDANGYPTIKYHAFGDTTPQCLATYPWFSADSSTWVIAAGMAGRIIINKVGVQFRSTCVKDYNYISSDDEGLVRETWENAFIRAGLDPDKCISSKMRGSDIMLIRAYMTAFHFLEVEETTREVDRYEEDSSFINVKKYGPGQPQTEPCKIHFVITDSTTSRGLAILTALGVKNALISYYYCGDAHWTERMLPYIYDPVGVSMSDKKICKELEFLLSYMINPPSVEELRARYSEPVSIIT
jgi:hypothetical protein